MRLTPRLDALRRSFWLPASVSLLLGLAFGLLMPSVDGWIDFDVPLVNIEPDSGSSLLQTIATVVMSVIGISFSVIVIALQLASQQLSPRVLRTFRGDRMSKLVLSLLVGTFVYCLAVLARLGSVPGEIPEMSVSVAVVLAMASIAVFVRFVQTMVELLQASTVIRRIADDTRHLEHSLFPEEIGGEPVDPAAATRDVERITSAASTEVTAPHAGYITAVDGATLVEAAAERDALVRQSASVGDFVLTGTRLAEVWDAADDGFQDTVAGAFEIGDERTAAHDPGFPVRQLADVALRALSPSMNDPTTAENAMGALADTLVRLARRDPPEAIRTDAGGSPRFVARVVTLDELVRLGFEQVRIHGEGHPVFAERLRELLEAIGAESRRRGSDCQEVARQLRLLSS